MLDEYDYVIYNNENTNLILGTNGTEQIRINKTDTTLYSENSFKFYNSISSYNILTINQDISHILTIDKLQNNKTWFSYRKTTK